jgi:hypothetical protein
MKTYGGVDTDNIHNLYFSPNTMMIKWRRMQQAGNAARMVEMRNAYILVGKPDEVILNTKGQSGVQY